jgi:hypothetical protein
VTVRISCRITSAGWIGKEGNNHFAGRAINSRGGVETEVTEETFSALAETVRLKKVSGL